MLENRPLVNSKTTSTSSTTPTSRLTPELYFTPSGRRINIMIDPTDPVRRYEARQRVQLHVGNNIWVDATIVAIAQQSTSGANQQYQVEYYSQGRREITSVGPNYLRYRPDQAGQR